MPNIRTYQNKIDEITPNNRGEQAVVEAGRVAGQAGQSISQSYSRLGQSLGGGVDALQSAYTEYATRQEISHGAATATGILAAKTDEWNQLAKDADPNDPTTAQRFRAGLEETFQKFTDAFQTKQGKAYAMAQVSDMRQHFFEKTAADQATLAGEAAHQNVLTLANNLSYTVHADPTSADVALGVAEKSIDGMVKADPRITADQAASLREALLGGVRKQIAKSAVIGAADQSPDAADQLLASGKFASYLDEGDSAALASYSRTQREATDRDRRQAEEDKRRKDTEQASAAAKQLYAAGVQQDGTWTPPPGFNKSLVQLAGLPGTSLAEVHEFGNMARTFTEDQANGTLVQSNPAVFTDMVKRMSLDPADPRALSRTEIYQAAAARQLGNHDAQTLVDGLDRNNDPVEKHLQKGVETFVEGQKPIILGNELGGATPDQYRRYYEFQVSIQTAVAQARALGLSPPQIEERLLDPTSKFYLGRQDSGWMRYYTSGADGDSLVSNIAPPGSQPAPAQPAQPAAPGKPAPGRPSLDDLAKANGLP